MFEKEAKEYRRIHGITGGCDTVFKDGAEFGYNKGRNEAKEIIKNLLFLHNDKFGSTRLEWRCNVVAEAEQFLNEVEK